MTALKELVGHFCWEVTALWKEVLVVLQLLADLAHCHPEDLADPKNRRRLPDGLLVLQVAGESLDLCPMGSVETRLK